MAIRILTWNVWLFHGDWEARQPAIAAVIDKVQPDVIALQESFDTHEGCRPQVETLAEHLGFEFQQGPNPEGFDAPVRNSMLSRWPMKVRHSALLAAEGPNRYRSVVGAHIETPEGLLPIFTTHLEHRFDRTALRQKQLGEAVAFIESVEVEDSLPPVLTGDLNAVPDSEEIRRLTGRTTPYDRVFIDAWDVAGEGDGLTYATSNRVIADRGSQWPNRRLDYIAIGYSSGGPKLRVRDISLAGTEPVDGVMASDHYGVVANLTT